jgi:hypothetical protein
MNEKIPTHLWARARAAYQAGETAGAVCARFRIGRSAFFAAAQAGGWRRADQGRDDPATEDEAPDPVGEALPSIDLAETAMARASAAVMAGRLHEAQGWTRLAGELRRMAADEVGHTAWVRTLSRTMDAEANGRVMADRLAAADSKPDSPDSSRTPIFAAIDWKDMVIGAGLDSVDCPGRSGLLASTALPRRFDEMRAWVETEAAKLEARERAEERRPLARMGGP